MPDVQTIERFIQIWCKAYDSCHVDSEFQVVAVMTRPIWNRLAQNAGIAAEKAQKAVADGGCNVQIFEDEILKSDSSAVLVVRILDSWEDKMTIVAIEKIK